MSGFVYKFIGNNEINYTYDITTNYSSVEIVSTNLLTDYFSQRIWSYQSTFNWEDDNTHTEILIVFNWKNNAWDITYDSDHLGSIIDLTDIGLNLIQYKENISFTLSISIDIVKLDTKVNLGMSNISSLGLEIGKKVVYNNSIYDVNGVNSTLVKLNNNSVYWKDLRDIGEGITTY